MLRKPTGTSFATPSVPRKSRSPSACSRASRNSMPSAVATAPRVTPAQATNASSSMSPEHAAWPVPPVPGCRPATASALPVSTLQVTPSPTRAWARKVIEADSGTPRYRSLSGLCKARNSSAFICKPPCDRAKNRRLEEKCPGDARLALVPLPGALLEDAPEQHSILSLCDRRLKRGDILGRQRHAHRHECVACRQRCDRADGQQNAEHVGRRLLCSPRGRLRSAMAAAARSLGGMTSPDAHRTLP